MIYLGISKILHICGICKKEIPTKSRVYINHEKRQGNHIAHEQCWDSLKATRERKWEKKKVEHLSHEELDPPF